MALYDYIYIDLPKVASLYSQLTGGTVELRETNSERSQTADNKRSYDLKVFKHDAGGTGQEKNTYKEIRKPHHALLQELEEKLANGGYMVTTSPSLQLSEKSFRQSLKRALCLKVRGRVVIEDYDRIKAVGRAFPELIKFTNRSAESNLRKSQGFITLQEKIKAFQLALASEKDRNVRSSKELQLKALKRSIDEKVATAGKVTPVEPWILEGFETWTNTLLPNIINLRVYPNPEYMDEHVFGNMKRVFFEDSDSTSFHFTYGSLPTEELTVVGIITSVPKENEDAFKPLDEFERQQLRDYEEVEKGFRGLFRGFDGLERMVRTIRFPRVLIQPLVVYRSVEPVLHSD